MAAKDYFTYSKIFTQTATTVSFVDDSAAALACGKFTVINTDAANSVWVDWSGNAAVADTASPTTNTNSVEVLPSTTFNWTILNGKITSMSVICAAGLTAKAIIVAE